MQRVVRVILATTILLGLQAPAFAYEGAMHQQLTFLAALHFNRCVEGTELPRLTPLQVRYIAKANARQADSGLWRKLFRWNYYNREDQAGRSFLWLFETRMHEHFNTLVARLNSTDDPAERYSTLGRLVNHLQSVTSPAQAVPVFTARWWRLNMSDRFSSYPINEDAVLQSLGDDCSPIYGLVAPGPEGNRIGARLGIETFSALLAAAADDTIAAIEHPISGMPVNWEVFWNIDSDPGSFGDYGDAGNNFGRQTEFRCTKAKDERCVLLNDDPIYADFARERHVMAVRVTVAAMAALQEPNQATVVSR